MTFFIYSISYNNLLKTVAWFTGKFCNMLDTNDFIIFDPTVQIELGQRFG